MKRVYNSLMAVQITEWTDRTGRAFPRLEARGNSLTEAFRRAAVGFYGLITDVAQVRPSSEVTIFCESSDSDWLFSDWINTLLYETRERGMLFSEFHVEVDGINVKGVIRGEAIDPLRHPLRREWLAGAAFELLYAEEGPDGARVSAVLNDEARHPLPLRELWKGAPSK
ncbi:MAG: archease [Bdellovibrionales bacterium]|nr:archease [Bdellovibrionales bacterium]